MYMTMHPIYIIHVFDRICNYTYSYKASTATKLILLQCLQATCFKINDVVGMNNSTLKIFTTAKIDSFFTIKIKLNYYYYEIKVCLFFYEQIGPKVLLTFQILFQIFSRLDLRLDGDRELWPA